jgi:hypothetical protein
MPLNKIKTTIEEFDGIRCAIVEKGISAERADFLTKLLEHNQYTVKSQKVEDGTLTIAVTDIMFNPVIDVYKRRLKSFTGHKVTPAYWLQISTAETEKEVNYWVD